VINSHTNTTDYLELWDVSKTLAAAAPVTALTSNSTCGITTGSGRHVDVSGSFPAEFAPGLKFRPVLAERTLTNFASFEGHNFEVDVFNAPRKTLLDHVQGQVRAGARQESLADQ
jgi:hypothetical protein